MHLVASEANSSPPFKRNKQISFKPGLFETTIYLILKTKKHLKLGLVMLAYISNLYLSALEMWMIKISRAPLKLHKNEKLAKEKHMNQGPGVAKKSI